MPFAGGQPAKTFDFLPKSRPHVQWTADGRAITYLVVGDDSSTLWEQPVDGNPPKQVTNFSTNRIVQDAWSRDGKQLALAVARGVATSDVVLISNFK